MAAMIFETAHRPFTYAELAKMATMAAMAVVTVKRMVE
eukprot:CAMPEP_0194303658 /NCGR_PEP_ID=MMETSP0171-20130528/1491_1 /TAXON_ID=218684 /ORGANISM="Corethron pennatum, Strain L29A3" /LENGTH=37 /DNA_ID= /DNA_START= /DNA_END= /DNA_ORIENTATION=